MKKLMFAAALATVCGAVQADAISSDIVGYQNFSPEKANKTILGIPFIAVDGGDYDIQDIKCMNGTSEPSSEAFQMWWWDTDLKKYVYAVYANPYWVDDGTDDGYGTETAEFGWATNDEDMFGYLPIGTKGATTDHAKSFASGEGFWLMPAGAVVNGTVTFPNPFYVAP